MDLAGKNVWLLVQLEPDLLLVSFYWEKRLRFS